MAAAIKRPASIRLDDNLMSSLKEIAKQSNRSFNNLVESILLNYVSLKGKSKHNYPISDNVPNEETAQVIRESMQGIGVTPVDMSSEEAMWKSLGLYDEED